MHSIVPPSRNYHGVAARVVHICGKNACFHALPACKLRLPWPAFDFAIGCSDIQQTHQLPLPQAAKRTIHRSEEHTSELQSRSDLVCRLLLEKKKQDIDREQQT